MFRKEYPPLLTGKPEDQLAAMRAYLVRLVGYIDEAIASVGSAGSSEMEQAALADWQKSVTESIGSLRNAYRGMDLVQHGSVSTTTDVVFEKPFSDIPTVIATAGTVSSVTSTGFTLTTSSAASWIAVGRR